MFIKGESSTSQGLVNTGWTFGPTGYTNWNCLWFDYDFSVNRGYWRTGTDSFTLNTWHHIAVTYDADSTANDPAFYYDGALIGSSESSTPSGTRDSDVGYDMWEACNKRSPAAQREVIDGMLADLRLYDRALSAWEIEAIYEQKGLDGILDGLLYWSRMDEGYDGLAATGTGTVYDIKNGNNGNPIDSPVYRSDEQQYSRSLNG